MIVKVSSAASFYQNQKAPTPTANHITRHNQTLVVADPTSTAPFAGVAHHHQPELIATEFLRPRQQPIKAPKHQKLKHIVMRNHQQQQQHYLQQHMPMMPMLPMQQHQQQQQQQIHSHAITGETAYLLERSDSNAHEQPIYGTWLTKAKRPQPPLVAAASAAATATAASTVKTFASTSAMSAHDDSDAVAVGSVRGGRGVGVGVGDNITEHYYERLPRRAATMTPNKSEIHDQVPRPPRFASRHPSMLQRQVMKTNLLDRNDGQPKPFHFPHDGPLPHEFTKFQSRPESERAEVNNIQDILKHLHLGNMPSKTPQLIMMPTGLHIAGSFKNLKSSGIGNFFRNKRQKKHLQLSIPMQMPMPWMGGYHQPPLIAYAPHQRIAMDQFYPFKPRSPHDINLLAMQQQMHSSHMKSKKKRKTPVLAHSPSLLLQHSNQRPFTADPFMQSYPYMFALNQSQKSKPKRVPFKLNLDIYPIATPTKDYKASAFTLEEAKILTTLRPASAMRNPFAEHYAFPAAPVPSASALHFSGGPRDNHSYNPPFNPSQPDIHQSNNAHSIYQNINPFYTNPPQLPKQQTQQQSTFAFPNQQQNNFATPVEQHINAPVSAASNANPSSNQLLVHLNVFPKQNSPASSSSTNPFYSGGGSNNPSTSINRQSTIGVGVPPAHIIPKVKSRCKNSNKTAAIIHQQPVSRSDNVESSIQPLIDFEHPIVAAEVPNAQPFVDNKLEEVASQQTPMEMRSNFKHNNSSNVDQMAAEAQTASLFRFPVEDLIQFQVDDAL